MSKLKRASNARRLAALNVLRVASAVASAETVTIGGFVFEVSTGFVAPTAGRIALDLSAGGVKASGTLTLTENAANTNTVTIGAKVYTLQTTLTNVDGNVKIGATASDTLDNLIAAITLGAGAGTNYAAAMTVHPTVTAAAGAGDTMTVTAKVTGTEANAYATTDTLAGSSAFGAATLQNGANPTAAEFTTSLNAAINANNIGFQSTRVSANEILIVTSDGDNAAVACTETLAGANNAWAAAATFGGAAPARGVPVSLLVARVPTAVEVALGTMHFFFGFAPSAAVGFARVTASGAVKAWDGAITVSGNRVTLDNAGSVDWAATDTVLCLASE